MRRKGRSGRSRSPSAPPAAAGAPSAASPTSPSSSPTFPPRRNGASPRLTPSAASSTAPPGCPPDSNPPPDNRHSAPRATHSKPLTLAEQLRLYARLGIDQSHSRPHVSNDNPYSEANFKTLKYCPAFPGEFGSIEDVNVFCRDFFWYYNNEHRHSGIAMHTPASAHDGSWVAVEARRAVTLQAAYRATPRALPQAATAARDAGQGVD